MYAPTSAKHLATEAVRASVTYLFFSSTHLKSDSPDKREHPWELRVQTHILHPICTRTRVRHALRLQRADRKQQTIKFSLQTLQTLCR